MIINPFEFNDNLINLFHINNKIPALIIFNTIGILFLSFGSYRQYYVCQCNFNLFIIFIGIFNILLGSSLFLMRIFNFFIYTLFLVTVVYITILFLLLKPYVMRENFTLSPGACMNNTGYTSYGRNCIVDGKNIDIETQQEIPGACFKDGKLGVRIPSISNECNIDTDFNNLDHGLNGDNGNGGNSVSGNGVNGVNGNGVNDNRGLDYDEKHKRWIANQLKLKEKEIKKKLEITKRDNEMKKKILNYLKNIKIMEDV